MRSPTRLITLVALALLLVYGVFEALPLLRGPVIRLSSPTDGQSFPDGLVTIAGDTTHANALTLDGAPLLIDQQGHFETSLILPKGGAILFLTATDRFGRQHSLERSVYIP